MARAIPAAALRRVARKAGPFPVRCESSRNVTSRDVILKVSISHSARTPAVRSCRAIAWGQPAGREMVRYAVSRVSPPVMRVRATRMACSACGKPIPPAGCAKRGW